MPRHRPIFQPFGVVRDETTRQNFERIKDAFERFRHLIAGDDVGDGEPNRSSSFLEPGILYGLSSSGVPAKAYADSSAYVRAVFTVDRVVASGKKYNPIRQNEWASIQWDGTGSPTPGNPLFLSATTPGKFTPTKPTTPDRAQLIGIQYEDLDSNDMAATLVNIQFATTA